MTSSSAVSPPSVFLLFAAFGAIGAIVTLVVRKRQGAAMAAAFAAFAGLAWAIYAGWADAVKWAFVGALTLALLADLAMRSSHRGRVRP